MNWSSLQHVSDGADGALGDDSLRLLIDAGDLASRLPCHIKLRSLQNRFGQGIEDK